MGQPIRLALLAVALAGALGASATALGQGPHRVYLPSIFTAGTPRQGNPIHTGEATYYDANGDGNCMLGPSPNDLMVAAIGYLDYGNPRPVENPAQGPAAVYCGAYVEATGPNGTVTVRIVDKCPDVYSPGPPSSGCGRGHLDMSPQAFARIAPLERGRVPITWRVVSPPLSGPIAYHFKEGSNQWWTAVQVRNHRNPIVKLEYRNSAGQWITVTRLDYNFFVEPRGMGPGPYTFRVTDSYGNVLEDSGIAHVEGGTIPGRAQFPAAP